MTKVIDSFTGSYHFLSNFYYCTIPWHSTFYPSVEHAYQASKTLVPNEREMIRTAPTAAVAKRLGRKATKRPAWEEIKLPRMEALLRHKFSNLLNQQLAIALMLTGDAELIECNTWGDTFWGVCNGIGENHLGKLLMERRDQLKGVTRRDYNAQEMALIKEGRASEAKQMWVNRINYENKIT